MKKNFALPLCAILALALSPLSPVRGQANINYEEAKAGSYELPALLQSPQGKPIATVREWEKQQRPALLQLFADHVYGRMPGRARGQHYQVRSVDDQALGGKAVRKLVTVYFTADKAGPSMEVLLYLPRQARGSVPVFAGLNFRGNHTVHTDPGIPLSSRWVVNDKNLGITDNRSNEASRGLQASRWQVEQLLDRGYGLATAYYGDLEPDHAQGWQSGIRSQLQQQLQIRPEDWGALGAWAWGMSRMLDYLETDKAVQSNRVVLNGHSRIGKAALWAGANDTRFAAVISNESGEGGAALARRWYGETTRVLNTSFPHWFSPAFKNYNDKPAALPVDQHMLLALVAPRPLYVASADGDQWADPKGEFLSALAAEPAWHLYGKKGLGLAAMPAVDQPVGQTVRYHNRSGKHDVTAYDWQQYLDFADQELGKKK
ncbi:MAG: acetylxylan esterase [Adhaeribacter sp.]